MCSYKPIGYNYPNDKEPMGKVDVHIIGGAISSSMHSMAEDGILWRRRMSDVVGGLDYYYGLKS